MECRLIGGDALASLRGLPAGSVHCIVTSPPYWGLRDYGVRGQLGLEATPDAYVARMVEVFREARRVLRDDGTLWLNLGDSYNSSPSNRQNGADFVAKGGARYAREKTIGRQRREVDGLKPKDLVGIPWRVAFALQADGWYLRSDIIWHKPNPMPESVRDRPTKGHEYLFLLAKSGRYYFDADAVAEASTDAEYRTRGKLRPGVDPLYVMTGDEGSGRYRAGLGNQPGGRPTRNVRTVWTVTPKPYKGAHFATMPPRLVEPCIKAGCPIGGTVLDPFCGSGTTGAVALPLGRSFVGIDLNPDYLRLARERIDAA